MSKIETADFLLDSDEPTYGMRVWEDEEGFKTRLVVARGDQLVGLVIHHGHDPEYSGKIPPMFIPSLEGENNVGLMLQLSEEHRHDLRWYKRIQEMKEGSTLITDIINQEWEALQLANNRSTFGPHAKVERNGFNRTQRVRDWFDERDRRVGYTRHFT